MEEVLVQGDTAGAEASPPCPFDAARREPPGGGRGAGATAPESVPVRGQEPGGNNHGGYRGPS